MKTYEQVIHVTDTVYIIPALRRCVYHKLDTILGVKYIDSHTSTDEIVVWLKTYFGEAEAQKFQDVVVGRL